MWSPEANKDTWEYLLLYFTGKFLSTVTYVHQISTYDCGNLIFVPFQAGYAIFALGITWILKSLEDLTVSLLCSCNIILLVVTGHSRTFNNFSVYICMIYLKFYDSLEFASLGMVLLSVYFVKQCSLGLNFISTLTRKR